MSHFEAISSTIKKIEKTMGRMEKKLVALEASQANTEKELTNFKESVDYSLREQDMKMKETTGELDSANKRLKELGEQNQQLSGQVAEIKAELDDLKTKDLYLEVYSRRENIIFRNIPETPWENTEEKLREFLRDDLDYSNYDTVEFQRVHRNPSKTSPRPIIARLLRYKDCEEILRLGKNLKGSNFSMFPDLPTEIVRRRRELVPILKKAKANKIPASFSKAKPDKLFVRGKEWKPGQELDTL
jgi:hypothetical protein